MLYLGAKAQSKNSCGTKQISSEILAGTGVLIKRSWQVLGCLSKDLIGYMRALALRIQSIAAYPERYGSLRT